MRARRSGVPAIALGVCVAVLVGAALAAPDDPAVPETRRFGSGEAGQRIEIDLPREWKVDHLDDPGSLMFLRLRSPKVEDFFGLSVARAPAIRNERGQAFADRGATKDEVGLEPLPHLVMDRDVRGEPVRSVRIYRVLHRLGFTVKMDCAPSAWPTLRDAAFRAAASLTSDFDEWPAKPQGYRESLRDGYEYLVNPAIKDKDVDALHAAVLEQEKRYAAQHGAVPKPSCNPIVVVVVPDRPTAGAVSLTATSQFGYAANWQEGRLFAVPLKKDDAPGRGELADRLAVIFHTQCYGTCQPLWLCDGERRVAAMEAIARKPLPMVPAEAATEFAASLVPFQELVTTPPKNAVAQSASYVAFFRAGGELYRDAFSAFLQDVASTGDWEAAQRKHLFVLDQEKLRTGAQTFIAKELKPVKPK